MLQKTEVKTSNKRQSLFIKMGLNLTLNIKNIDLLVPVTINDTQLSTGEIKQVSLSLDTV